MGRWKPRPWHRRFASNVAALGGGGGVDFSLDFTTGSLPAEVTLTRASAGTYFNSSGVMQTAATDAARFDYNPGTLALRGLLIEPAATNFLLRSAELGTTWTAQQVSITANSDTAPDGNAAMDTLTGNGATNPHSVYQTSASPASGAARAISCFAKAGTNSNFIVTNSDFNDNENHIAAVFDLSGVTVGQTDVGAQSGTISSSSIVSVGGSIYRCVLSGSIVQSATPYYLFGMAPNASGNTFSAFGEISFASSATIKGWGFQLEAGSVATSHIPTAGSTVTRAADVASFTIPTGVTSLRYTFDDDSTQDVSVTAGAYQIPTDLNRPWIKTIEG